MTATVTRRRTSDDWRRRPKAPMPLDERIAQLDDAYCRLLDGQAAHPSRWRPFKRRFPLSAVYLLTGPTSTNEMAERVGYHPRQVSRWHSEGSLTIDHADVVACALGLHPCLIWPEWFE